MTTSDAAAGFAAGAMPQQRQRPRQQFCFDDNSFDNSFAAAVAYRNHIWSDAQAVASLVVISFALANVRDHRKPMLSLALCSLRRIKDALWCFTKYRTRNAVLAGHFALLLLLGVMSINCLQSFCTSLRGYLSTSARPTCRDFLA
jgi:hypothetical protein